MPIETAAFNEKLIQAIKKKDEKVLKELLKTSSITNYVIDLLIQDNDKETCIFLVSNQFASLEDFVCGAAKANNQVLVDFFLEGMHKANITPNYNRVAARAAFGGHLALAEHFLKQIKDESKRDYIRVAGLAAQGGHQAVVEHFFNQIKDESKRDYKRVANLAKQEGHHALANKYNALAQTQKSGPTISHPSTAVITPPKVAAPKVIQVAPNIPQYNGSLGVDRSSIVRKRPSPGPHSEIRPAAAIPMAKEQFGAATSQIEKRHRTFEILNLEPEDSFSDELLPASVAPAISDPIVSLEPASQNIPAAAAPIVSEKPDAAIIGGSSSPLLFRAGSNKAAASSVKMPAEVDISDYVKLRNLLDIKEAEIDLLKQQLTLKDKEISYFKDIVKRSAPSI